MSKRNSKSHQNKRGRPRKDADPEGSNISELSRLTGVDRAALRRICADVKPVRTVGSQKFYLLADIQAAISQKPSKTLKDEKLFEEIRKFRIANDRSESKLVLKSEVFNCLLELSQNQFKILTQRLLNEMPVVVAGLEPPAARIYFRRILDEICNEMARSVEHWKI